MAQAPRRFLLQANAIGRSSKMVREFLEKNYTEAVAADDDQCIKLTIKALLEVIVVSAVAVVVADVFFCFH